ncbi:hypothetical protein [Peterkaempfera sp. SMS 1(5)a]|uniref:hypothetical protein n=1 Tax=Peterkaempfera podocarpi TaxID=3232308 RepID=UPI003671CE22
MSSVLSNSGDLSHLGALGDLQRAVDRANDAVRAYVAEVEGELRRCGDAEQGGRPSWNDRQSATLADLQGVYLVALQALRTASKELDTAA